MAGMKNRFVEAVERCRNDTLYFGEKGIADEDCEIICKALEGNETIHNVNLGGNEISDRGAVAISNLIRGNKVLWKIRLDGNAIGDDGARAMIDALRENKTIQYIYVKFNAMKESLCNEVHDLSEDINGVRGVRKMETRSEEISDETSSRTYLQHLQAQYCWPEAKTEEVVQFLESQMYTTVRLLKHMLHEDWEKIPNGMAVGIRNGFPL